MADVYLKKVDASSRSEWTSGNSYVIGDRVYLASATMQDTYWNDGATTFATWRTFVCLADNSSTTSPEVDSTNWIEAGTSKEYPYHCIGGDLTASSTNSEIYLEEENTRWSTQSLGGATFYHLRRGESQFSLGKLIIVSDTPNPVFIVNKDVAIIGFSIEPDSSTERFSIVCMNGGKLGSHVSHNIHDTQYGKIDKCNIYYSGTNTYMFGIIYDNLSKIEFTDCLFSEQASEVGYADLSAPAITLGLRNFVGLRRCSFFFPSVDLSNHFIWDSQAHSIGVESFIESCSFSFKSYKATSFLYNFRSGISIKNNIFYFSGSDGQEIRVINNTHNNFECKNNVLYIGDNSATFNYINAGEDYSEKLKNINPKFVSNDSPKGMQLRPSSPLIGGMDNSTKQLQIEFQYPQGKWFDSNAAAGGDGSWETPYNNYGEAINSFTGDEAVVLIKEGQHPLLSGSPDSSGNFSHVNDLPKVYSNGIKFIGMGPGSVFDTSSNGIKNYGAFWSSSTGNPNSKNTPFLFKDFDILMNNSGYINRGMICCRRAEYINVNTTQALNLGVSNSQLFDYTTQSGSGDSGEYLKMSGCTVNVSLSRNSSNTAYLVGSAGGLKQYSSCTFADLNRTTSMTADPPTQFAHTGFGTYAGSYIKDCIIYANNNTTSMFGNQYSSDALDIKNVVVYNAHIALTQNPSVSVSNKWSDNVSTTDPKFVATEPHDFDLRLRPDSPAIGGIKTEATNVYYLQPGNPFNGDGSQKDASVMTADGDPGPFNEFDKILAAGVPYGSKIIILNGTYPWPEAFDTQKSPTTWADYTYEGYSYHAETPNEVIFDASNQQKTLGHYTLGGVAGSGTHIDLHTSFNGVQFNRSLKAQAWPHNTTAIYSTTDTLGKGSLTFNSCKFLGWIQGPGYNWTGGNRAANDSPIHWNSCTISIAYEQDNGSLLGGMDKLADDSLSANWSWTNCVFYSPHGETTFYGNNAPNGTWFGPSQIFGTSGMQSSRIFKGNIFYVPGGDTTIAGTLTTDKWPQISNNALIGVDIDAAEQSLLNANNNLIDVDPLFVDPSNNNFSLRPLSPLIGQG